MNIDILKNVFNDILSCKKEATLSRMTSFLIEYITNFIMVNLF